MVEVFQTSNAVNVSRSTFRSEFQAAVDDLTVHSLGVYSSDA